MSKKYRIYVGSWDYSVAIEKELTEDELKVVQMIASEIEEANEYASIMDMMTIEELKVDGDKEIWILVR